MRETSNRFSKKVCRYQRLPTKKAFRNIQQNVLLDNTQPFELAGCWGF